MLANNPRVVVTVEGRIASSRLPGKILYPLAGVPMLEQIVRRARSAVRVHEVVVATTVLMVLVEMVVLVLLLFAT